MSILQWLRDIAAPYLGRDNAHRTGAGERLRERRYRIQSAASAFSKINFLPWLDEATGDSDTRREAYRKMMIDDAVKGAVCSKLFAVASLDPAVLPADPDNKLDRKAAEFIQSALERMAGGIRGTVEDVIYPLIVDGYVTNEKVYGELGRGKYARKWTVQRLRPLFPRDYTLELDEFGQWVRVIGQGQNTGKEWDKRLFTYLKIMPLYDNPRGQSDLAASYRPFFLKDTLWKIRKVYLEYFASGPYLVGKYGNADSDKSPLEAALKLAKGASWVTIPETAQIQVLDLAMKSTSDFADAIEKLDREIVNGISGAILQSMEGAKTGSYNQGLLHATTSDLRVWYLAEVLSSLFNDQVIPDLCDLNFVGLTDYPRVTFGGVNDADLKASLELDMGLATLIPLSSSELYAKYRRKPPTDPGDAIGGKPSAPPPNYPPPAPGGQTFSEWDESKHPRGDDGKWITKGEIDAAKSDPTKAAALRAAVTDPGERKKLDEAIGPASVKPNKLSRLRVNAVSEKAAKIKVTDDVISGTKVDSIDYDEIEARMTDDEKTEMANALDDMRRETIDSVESDEDFSPDRAALAEDLGYTSADIEEKALQLLAEAGLPESKAAELASAIAEWRRLVDYTGETGEAALSSLGWAIPAGDTPFHEAWDSYRTDALAEIEEKARDKEDKAQSEWRLSMEDQYDGSSDRHDYLRSFYDDHPDQMGAVVAEKDVWGKDGDGDLVYSFETSSGKSYDMLVYNVDLNSMTDGAMQGSVPSLSFADSSGNFKVTGAGSAAEVFTQVSAATVALVQNKGIDLMHFSAAEPSRQKVYDRLVRTAAATLPGYVAAAIVTGGGPKHYMIGKREKIDELRRAATLPAGTKEELIHYAEGFRVVILKSEFDPAWVTPKGWADESFAEGPWQPPSGRRKLWRRGTPGNYEYRQQPPGQHEPTVARYPDGEPVPHTAARDVNDRPIGRDYSGASAKERELAGKGAKPERYKITEAQAITKGAKPEVIAKLHRSHVERAIAEGKPVPPEVLADYPDLAEKHAPKAPAGSEKPADLKIETDGVGTYTVKKGGKEIARANVADDGRGDYLTSVSVHPDYRRQGVASQLYDRIEADIGRALRPSPTNITPDGQAFRAGREAKKKDGKGNDSPEKGRETKADSYEPWQIRQADYLNNIKGSDSEQADARVAFAEARIAKTLSAVTKAAERHGIEVLADIAHAAVARRMQHPAPSASLFTDEERQRLADALAATLATARLAGRATMRAMAERKKRVVVHGEPVEYQVRFALEPVGVDADGTIRPITESGWLEKFDDTNPPNLFAPEKALEYFKGLHPKLGELPPERFGPLMQREAFTLAVATEEVLLVKVQEAIVQFLQGVPPGEPYPEPTAKVIDKILIDAGVGRKGPAYAEMVFRTNAHDAYITGSEAERMDPDVLPVFPVWRWDSIDDERTRDTHRARYHKYYPGVVSFQAVRGSKPEDVINCRCVPTAIYIDDWEELQASGAKVETTW